MVEPVLAAHTWRSNAFLIEDVARLGWLRSEWETLDPTWGRGVFWKRWRPDRLVASDLYTMPERLIYRDGVIVHTGRPSFDFRAMPYPDASWDAVVLDPPYKLNGTPTEKVDTPYGVDKVMPWQERMQMIRDGITECARVVKPRGIVLVKCQAQVVSGAIRWQDIEFTNHAATKGLTLVDRFDLLGTGRNQPQRTRKDGKPSVQQHAYGRPSSLLVFRKVGLGQ